MLYRPGLGAGFTLIELSIVLVIVGLVVGGVLVGQDLIRAAHVRAAITQIEKYNQAANTFYGKYGFLPGDIAGPAAGQFGFAARGNLPGEGDGNGIIEGVVSGANQGYGEGYGETVMFWADLSKVGMIEGSFVAASASAPPGTVTTSSTPSLDAFFPQSRLGGGNYVYVWSGGLSGGDGRNYFGIAAITTINTNWEVEGSHNGTRPESIPVAVAYAIDSKVDDGSPYTGIVTTMELDGGPVYATDTGGVGGQATCSDNPNGIPGFQQYALDINHGAGANCALSFRFQ